jgi:hypothetical protein
LKKEIPLPGAFGVPSSMFRKREGLPVLPARTWVDTAARTPPVGAL